MHCWIGNVAMVVPFSLVPSDYGTQAKLCYIRPGNITIIGESFSGVTFVP
jgi:hypothetical protein